MDFAAIITTYGYPALFAGALLEGGTIVIIAGFLAHQGYLSLPFVMMTACAGAFAADQFLFQLGKRKGSQYLANKPGWQLKVDKIRRFLETYQVIAILTYRFIYGMRTITPVIIGASRFSTRRFIFLNLCATMLWALLVSMGGYFFGHMLERFLQNVRRYEYATIISIVVVAGVVWLWQIRPQQK